MHINELRELVKNLILEDLKLRRISDVDLLAVVSDKTDRKDASIETFKNKNKLKSSGFEWKSEYEAWTISTDKLKYAQDILNSINKIQVFIDKLEDVEEFVNNTKKTELSNKIESYIKSLMDSVDEEAASEEIQRFLEFGLKFHNYSFTNTILIYIQNQNASKVAGLKQWEEKFHRRVRKGSKAITIYAPIIKKDAGDTSAGDKGLDDPNKPMSQKIIGYKAVNVFDISDTDPIDSRGEIPAEPKWFADDTPNELADKLYEYVSELADSMGIHIGNEASKRGEMGWASGDHINLSSNIAGLNKVSTLVHEIAHELMHFNKKSIFYIRDLDSEKRFTKDDIELQAESVCYVVLKHYGFPVKHQSTYLAMWKANSKAIKDNMDIIKKVSNFIITEIDKQAAKDPEFAQDQTES